MPRAQPKSGKAASSKPSGPPAFPGLLEEMTIEEVRAFKARVVVLPLGSTEPHGPHLPYGTDTFQVTRLCREAVAKANARGARALLYPALPITNNANARKLPFALRMGVRTLMTVLVDIATQVKADGVDKIVIVNGHGGNPGAILATLREIAGMDNMPFVCSCEGGRQCAPGFQTPIEHASDHAGESETSRMLSIRPDLVRTAKLGNFPRGKVKVPMLATTDFVRPWHCYLPESAGGETRTSNAAKGETLYVAESDGIAELLVQLAEAKFDARFPYE